MDKKKCNKMRFRNLKREYLNKRKEYEKMNSLLEQEVKESLILNH
jgi:hypothetical protein